MGCVIALPNLVPVRPFFAKLFPMRLVADLHPDFRMRLQMRIGDRIGRVDVQVQPVRTLFQMIGRKTQDVGRGPVRVTAGRNMSRALAQTIISLVAVSVMSG